MAAQKKSRKSSKKLVAKKASKKRVAKKTSKKRVTAKKASKKKASKRAVTAKSGGKNNFGVFVRAVRLEAGLGLRRVSEQVGMSPAYLSMVERGELDPPTRPKIVAMAKVLKQDQDALLALAGKVSADIPVLLLRHPEGLCALLRATRSMSKDKIDKLLAQAKKMKR